MKRKHLEDLNLSNMVAPSIGIDTGAAFVYQQILTFQYYLRRPIGATYSSQSGVLCQQPFMWSTSHLPKKRNVKIFGHVLRLNLQYTSEQRDAHLCIWVQIHHQNTVGWGFGILPERQECTLSKKTVSVKVVNRSTHMFDWEKNQPM